MTTSRKSKHKSLLKISIPLAVLLLAVIGTLYTIKAQFSHIDTSIERAEIEIDKILPDMTLFHLNGTVSRLSEINAKILMVTFWATWCEACMIEMPSIVQLRNKFKDQGFEVLGINLDENSEVVVPRTVKQFKIEFPIFKDQDGKTSEFFDVRAIPLTVIFDRHRKVLYIKDGEFNWNSPTMQGQLERWLAG